MLVVVGGHSRNIGKTSVVCALIAAAHEADWQAFKVTQHGHDICATDGDVCGCAPEDPTHPYAIDEQLQADGTDTGRYLTAGARRAWWVRTAQGELGHAIGHMKALFREAENNIVESNSILRFVQPDRYIVVVHLGVEDLKDSARLYMDRADAFVMTGGEGNGLWPGIPPRWFQNKPVLSMPDLTKPPQELACLLATKI